MALALLRKTRNSVNLQRNIPWAQYRIRQFHTHTSRVTLIAFTAFLPKASAKDQPLSIRESLEQEGTDKLQSRRKERDLGSMPAVDEATLKTELMKMLETADFSVASERTIREDLVKQLGDGVLEHRLLIKDEIAAKLAKTATQKRKAQETIPSSDSKVPKTSAPAHDEDVIDVSEGVDLGNNKKAEVSTFKGITYVGIREWYEKDGKMMPGAKGISLHATKQFSQLVDKVDEISNALERQDTDYVFEITDKRKVSISKFAGNHMVDIREYYEKDGEMRPGKKGISLRQPHWDKLKKFAAALLAEAERR